MIERIKNLERLKRKKPFLEFAINCLLLEIENENDENNKNK